MATTRNLHCTTAGGVSFFEEEGGVLSTEARRMVMASEGNRARTAVQMVDE